MSLQCRWGHTHFLLLITSYLVTYTRNQRYTYRVLQTIQMKLIQICVWPERAILGSAKTVLKFKYEIEIYTIQYMGQGIAMKSERNIP